MSKVFQRKLEGRLVSITYVKLQSNDILISGKNNIEHLKNLRKVLKIIGNDS